MFVSGWSGSSLLAEEALAVRLTLGGAWEATQFLVASQAAMV